MEKSLRDLIARLPIPGLKESTDRHVISETLTRELGIKIKPKDILVKEGIITVTVPPVVKSALQIRQTKLISVLAREGIKVTLVR